MIKSFCVFSEEVPVSKALTSVTVSLFSLRFWLIHPYSNSLWSKKLHKTASRLFFSRKRLKRIKNDWPVVAVDHFCTIASSLLSSNSFLFGMGMCFSVFRIYKTIQISTGKMVNKKIPVRVFVKDYALKSVQIKDH